MAEPNRDAESYGLLDLVGTIYDAVIEPERWHDALDAICERFRFYNAMLDLADMAGPTSLVRVMVRVPPEFQNMATPAHISAVAQMWGGVARLRQAPLEEPLIQSEATDPATWEANLYFEEFGKPQGLVDAVAIHLVRDGPVIGALGLGRHRSAGPIAAAEMDALRILAPHLRRAVTISGLLRTATSAAATFETALDASASGVVLVDAGMRIVHANEAAKIMLAAGDPIRERAGLLELPGEHNPDAVSSAVRAATQEATLGRRGIGISARRADGSPLVVTVMPLERRSLRAGASIHASAAVFVADVRAPANPPGAMSDLYNLTPMEAQVFDLIAAGCTTDEAAQTLGVAASTFRTHVLHLFDKTGRRSRAGLVKLAGDIRPPG